MPAVYLGSAPCATAACPADSGAGPVRMAQREGGGVAAARFELYVPARPAGAARGRERSAAPVTWRLLAGNNRDLGRAAGTFPDVASCHAALLRLRTALVEPAVSVTSPDGRTRWRWRIGAGPESAAVASRVYQRRVQAEAACAAFVSLAAHAPVAEVVRLVGAGGAARR
jgi:hypothetical protein